MPHYEYGFNMSKLVPGTEVAKAQQYNIDASFKDLCAVCDNVRGLSTEDAVKYLESVANGFPVLYRRWNTKLGHRRELDGQKGRYPIKSAKFVAMVLQNAIANATAKGMSDTKVIHAAANKQTIYPRTQSKGRQVRSDYETSRVEIILAGVASEESKKQATLKKFVSEEAGKKREEIKEAVQKVKEEKGKVPEKQVIPTVAKITETKTSEAKPKTESITESKTEGAKPKKERAAKSKAKETKEE